MNPIGIEFITVFGLPPVEFVCLAADLGCQHISTGLMPMPFKLSGASENFHPLWSLRDNAKLRREMVAAMRDRDVSISLGEGFSIRADTNIQDRADDLALFRELGVNRINTVAIDPDIARCQDQIGLLVDMARGHEMETVLEFGPGLSIGTLADALKTVHTLNQASLKLLIDTMHFFRSNAQVNDLAAIDPALIGYIQLSDAPINSSYSNYMEEAMFNRQVPGQGELPLQALLDALPKDCVIGLEIPRRAVIEAGIQPKKYCGEIIAATQDLLMRR